MRKALLLAALLIAGSAPAYGPADGGALCGTDSECAKLCSVVEIDCDGGPAGPAPVSNVPGPIEAGIRSNPIVYL